MMKCVLSLLLLFITAHSGYSPVFAQTDSAYSIPAIIGNDISLAWHHSGELISAPLHFSETKWLAAGAIVAGTVILFSADEHIRDFAQRNQSNTSDALSKIGTGYGGIYGVLFSGGIYAGGLFTGDKELRNTGLMLIESVTFSFTTTTILKGIIGRSRPHLGDGPRTFNLFQFHEAQNSLPSGHTTVAFAISSVLAQRIDNAFATAGLYSLAVLTAYSRVYQDDHWFSDTFLGAAIGTAFGYAVVRLHERELSSSLLFIPTGNGLRAELRF